ncbi:MAG: GAF domain-containing protein, partial [Acidobacteriota bacterium]
MSEPRTDPDRPKTRSKIRLAEDPCAEDNDLSSGITCLLAATRDLHASTDFRQGLEQVAERLAQYVDYDTFAVLLLDDRGRELHFEYAVGFSPDVQKHWRFGLGQGIVGTVAQSGESILVDDTAEDSRYIHATERVRSELALPLVTKRRTIGVLDLGSYQTHHFDQNQQRLL